MIANSTISIRVKLSGAVATNQCPITGHFVQMSEAGVVYGVQPIHSATNSTTAVTVVPTAFSGLSVLKNLQVANEDTASIEVIIEQYDGSTAKTIALVPLAINQYLTLDAEGKITVSTTGGIVGTGTVTQVQGNGTVNGLSLSGNVTTSGNITLGGALNGTAPALTAGNVTNIPSLSGVITGNSTGTTTLTTNGTNSTGVASWVSDETGTGSLVFGTNCSLVTANLGTPSFLNLTNGISLPLTTGVTGTLPVANAGVDQTAWSSWTPSWTGITIGNASVTARYKQIGKTVFSSIDVIFGTTTSVSGAAQYVSLPVTSVSRISTSIMGQGVGLLSVFLDMAAWYDTTTRAALVFRTSSIAGTASSFSASTVSWANTHKLSINLEYEAA